MASKLDPSHPSAYSPKATALLFLDYHNMFFLSAFQDTIERDKVIASAKVLLVAARNNNVPIIHCLIDPSKDPLPANKLTASWFSTYKPAFTSGPDLAPEYAELAELPNGEGGGGNEFTVTRLPGYVSALKSDGIITLLKEELGVKSLVLCGLSSGGCVLSTASHAADEDFVVTIAKDACYDPKPRVHEIVMQNILPSRGWIVDLEEAVGYLSGATAAAV